jgi:CRP-like cAMP-binding protein
MKAFLKTLDLFRDLTDEELDLLASPFQHETFRKGDPLFRERDPGGKVYLVDCGVVELTKSGGGDGRPTRLALLERGEVLGELSLADDGPRNVTAVAAVTPETRVYSVAVPELQALLAQHPPLAAKIQRALLRRLATRLRAATEAVQSVVRAMS